MKLTLHLRWIVLKKRWKVLSWLKLPIPAVMTGCYTNHPVANDDNDDDADVVSSRESCTVFTKLNCPENCRCRSSNSWTSNANETQKRVRDSQVKIFLIHMSSWWWWKHHIPRKCSIVRNWNMMSTMNGHHSMPNQSSIFLCRWTNHLKWIRQTIGRSLPWRELFNLSLPVMSSYSNWYLCNGSKFASGSRSCCSWGLPLASTERVQLRTFGIIFILEHLVRSKCTGCLSINALLWLGHCENKNVFSAATRVPTYVF